MKIKYKGISTMTSHEELLSCIFCKEYFHTKEELQIHFRKHGDPKFNQSVKNRTSTDSDGCGDKSADVDLVSCDVCSETFPSISKAITHKHKVHPDHDAKYFCPWCGKLFTMKHLYNKHVETSHNSKVQYDSNGFHCDYCEADFFAPSAMVYHNKFFHRQDTELAAIGQSKKLKLFDQEMLPLYYCPFCGEEYFNKVNLHKHMGDDHSDENQSPDDVLRCPLCEAIFYHLDAYELHLTFHSIEDTYSEENEIVKNITEFSLEAVPPIMEKVENETTADSETTTNSMGIGEFLQLGMDETAGSETDKRKKKKKHKKSKKSITLDEFLNMNKDVFGEGLDVEGIEEVPTRVVAKRLKTRPQRPKPSANIVSASEIEKLKKQGIVVQKKFGNVPRFHSSLKGNLGGRSLNVTQNRLVHKTSADRTNSNSTNAVLSKLLNQSNSQLKIVKKPLVQATNSDLTKQSNTIDDSTNINEEASAEQNINKSEKNGNENSDFNEKSEAKLASNNTIESNLNVHSPKPKQENDNTLEKHGEEQNEHENTEVVNNINKQCEETDTCTIEKPSKRVNDSAENKDDELNLNELSENNKLNKRQENITNIKQLPLDTLKKLSNLTVKSLNQASVSTNLNVTKTGDHVCKKTDEPCKSKQELLQKPKDDKNMEALKLLSKNITITSSNKPMQGDINLCSNQGQDEDKMEKLLIDNSINKEEQSNKPKDDKNLVALKSLGGNITIKSSNKKTQENNVQDDGYDQDQDDNKIEKLKIENSTNKEVQPNKPKDDKNLEALKFLGKNITIKSSNLKMQENNDRGQDKDEQFKIDNSCNKRVSPQKSKDDRNLEALKQLSKVISIKSPNQPVPTDKYVRNDNDEECTNQVQNKTVIKNFKDLVNDKNSNIQSAVKFHQANNPVSQNVAVNSPKINKALLVKEESSNLGGNQQPVKTQHCDILKQFPNITAKPVLKTRQQIYTAVSKASETILNKEGTCVKSAQKFKEIKEIETFNIDDSDDEDQMRHSSTISNNTSMKSSKTSWPNSSLHHTEKLKNLGHQVTIKSTSRQNPGKISIHNDDFQNSDEDWDAISQETHNEGVSKDSKQWKMKDSRDQKGFVLHNKLTNLNQHVTVKSRNSSPQQINLRQDNDSDTKIVPAKVKITELTDDFSDDELNESPDGQPSSCVVESPEEYSENEELEGNNEQDIETQLKSNALRKPTVKTNNSPLNNLHNISKDITIKSLRNKNNPEDEDEATLEMNNEEDSNKDSSLKRQSNFSSQHLDKFNYQVAKSSDLEHNTANTEVIVKKFGTKTVIEEITTTVTKTIRTVNQTVQQEITNSSQIITPSIQSQRNHNTPRQQVYEGNQIRHATPTIGTRVRNVTPQVRPSIRPTNQIVSVRPGLNIRPSNQRMTFANKPTSTTTSNTKQPIIGKPLKISPNVFSPSNKRPTTEDSNGPFSCFKKQKESLIPVGDLAEISKGDNSVLYTFSQMSKSHVSNNTKIITGNSTMTSSQMKSESCASSKQLNRLANMSGLKVVKTSSAHHISKVEDCKMSKSNQTAFEAIERLKKQGLLIKKPRLDENYSEHSNSDDE